MAPWQSVLEQVFREDRARILATLVRLLGDFDLAEEMLQEAWAAAILQWPESGTPDNPASWLISTARFRGIDHIRRQQRARDLELLPAEIKEEGMDDLLRLIFTCCHPALPLDGQVALTLRTLCGLETEEIARLFLVPVPTMAQRLVRVKAKIRTARIPYIIPERNEFLARLEAVLAVVYLVFTEGYSASGGTQLVRSDLCAEAIRLARLLVALLPGQAEPLALLALILLQDSRRPSRIDSHGRLVLLEHQDREQWNQAQIREGLDCIEKALRAGAGACRYGLEAAIAAVHAEAKTHDDTDWPQIVALYDRLLALEGSAVMALNRAVAIGMAQGPSAGLAALTPLEAPLAHYYLLPAVKADFLRRLARWPEALSSYEDALRLVGTEHEREFLEGRRREAYLALSSVG